MGILTQIVVWLNQAANALGRGFFFIGVMPGWLSATIVAMLSGIAMIIAFKYTSNQRAIKRVRQDIRANLLAVKLFHDSLLVGFRAQGRVLAAALRLLLLAIVPILAMLVPVLLLLGQLNLWYETSPLPLKHDALVTLTLRGEADGSWPALSLQPTDAVQNVVGPVRGVSQRDNGGKIVRQREVCWVLRAQQEGPHRLVFLVGDEAVEKELAVGDAYMPVSVRRPDWSFTDVLFHPRERPFDPQSLVESIEVEYPPRSSWTSGTFWWVIYWFAVSLVTGFFCRGLFGVHL